MIGIVAWLMYKKICRNNCISRTTQMTRVSNNEKDDLPHIHNTTHQTTLDFLDDDEKHLPDINIITDISGNVNQTYSSTEIMHKINELSMGDLRKKKWIKLLSEKIKEENRAATKNNNNWW